MNISGARVEKIESVDEVFEKMDTYRSKNDIFIQLFDAEKVVGKEHLIWAFQKAKETFENDTNRANDLEMETLLWASGEWQIKDAIDNMGIDDETKDIALIVEKNEVDFLEYMGWTKDDDVLKPSLEKLENFGIQPEEIDSVNDPFDLVFEKMATSVL